MKPCASIRKNVRNRKLCCLYFLWWKKAIGIVARDFWKRSENKILFLGDTGSEKGSCLGIWEKGVRKGVKPIKKGLTAHKLHDKIFFALKRNEDILPR